MKVTRLFDIIDHQIAQYDKEVALAQKTNGSWRSYSSRDVKQIVDNVSLALLQAGIQKGQKVAIISNNRPEWNFIDLALQQIHAVSVPMYPTISADDYAYIFEHAEVAMIFVGDEEILAKAKVANADKNVPIYTFDQIKGEKYWKDFMDSGESGNLADLHALKEQVREEDLFTIIYTSGTTGRPKGVMLSHANVMHNVRAVEDRIVAPKGTSKALSFLPLCHIYERTGSFCFMYMGISIYYAKSMETIADNLKEVQPEIFNTVPRLLEKVYDKIVAKGYELTGVKKSLFFWALNLGLKYEPTQNQGAFYNFQLKIANKLIFSKWREALGGKIIQINSGASALQPRLARVFWSAGIPVCEGYGLTETSPVVAASVRSHQDIRIGCVGKIVRDVEVRIAEDGEVQVKGPNVMMGYYKQPEMTADVLKDGWFSTGDIGEIVEKHYLKITDRKKEMFKTSGGKYIAPQPMENKFKESTLIEQLIIVGENQKYPAALIVPSFDGLRDYCKHKDIPYTTDAEMIQKPEIMEKFDREIEQLNKYFGNWEQIKRYTLLSAPWTVETGELTPTMKLKRKIIHSKYAQEIERLYV
ncbi:MAG: AMP-dependent synthetase/ligase [Nitritalea sp.]